VPIEEVSGVIEKGIGKGLKGREMQATARAMADGARKGIETAPMTTFVHQKLDEGLRGEALSAQIEAEVERRHAEKVKNEEMAAQQAQEALEREQAAKAKKWWQFWK
ncbi:MAG TPA: hypothetical protein PLY04_17915, partial [bacterium]|nr:hypothetical protein [bacterium]